MTLGQLAKTFRDKLVEKKFCVFSNPATMHLEPVRVTMNFSKREMLYLTISQAQINDMLAHKMLEELRKHMVVRAMSRPHDLADSYEAEIFVGIK